jgi:hypothetical protein
MDVIKEKEVANVVLKWAGGDSPNIPSKSGLLRPDSGKKNIISKLDIQLKIKQNELMESLLKFDTLLDETISFSQLWASDYQSFNSESLSKLRNLLEEN